MKKNIATLILFIALSITIFAQDTPVPTEQRTEMLRKIEVQKIAYITTAMNLTPEESQQFWPVYNQYTEKMRTIAKEGKIGKKPIDMDEAESDNFIKQQLDKEIKLIELKREYIQKYRKFLSFKKILLLLKAEKEFKGELLNTIKNRKNKKELIRKPNGQ
jgi:hypothetical protein